MQCKLFKSVQINLVLSCLEEIEQREIELTLQVPNSDNITCLRETGRNSCPCKNVGHFISSACHVHGPLKSMCMNKRSVLESDANRSTSDSEYQEDPMVSTA